MLRAAEHFRSKEDTFRDDILNSIHNGKLNGEEITYITQVMAQEHSVNLGDFFVSTPESKIDTIRAVLRGLTDTERCNLMVRHWFDRFTSNHFKQELICLIQDYDHFILTLCNIRIQNKPENSSSYIAVDFYSLFPSLIQFCENNNRTDIAIQLARAAGRHFGKKLLTHPTGDWLYCIRNNEVFNAARPVTVSESELAAFLLAPDSSNKTIFDKSDCLAAIKLAANNIPSDQRLAKLAPVLGGSLPTEALRFIIDAIPSNQRPEAVALSTRDSYRHFALLSLLSDTEKAACLMHSGRSSNLAYDILEIISHNRAKSSDVESLFKGLSKSTLQKLFTADENSIRLFQELATTLPWMIPFILDQLESRIRVILVKRAAPFLMTFFNLRANGEKECVANELVNRRYIRFKKPDTRLLKEILDRIPKDDTYRVIQLFLYFIVRNCDHHEHEKVKIIMELMPDEQEARHNAIFDDLTDEINEQIISSDLTDDTNEHAYRNTAVYNVFSAIGYRYDVLALLMNHLPQNIRPILVRHPIAQIIRPIFRHPKAGSSSYLFALLYLDSITLIEAFTTVTVPLTVEQVFDLLWLRADGKRFIESYAEAVCKQLKTSKDITERHLSHAQPSFITNFLVFYCCLHHQNKIIQARTPSFCSLFYTTDAGRILNTVNQCTTLPELQTKLSEQLTNDNAAFASMFDSVLAVTAQKLEVACRGVVNKEKNRQERASGFFA